MEARNPRVKVELVTLSQADRINIDNYLAAVGRDPRAATMASRCRQAINVREIELGRALPSSEIAFTSEELAFLRQRVLRTRDQMDALLGLLKEADAENCDSDPQADPKAADVVPLR